MTMLNFSKKISLFAALGSLGLAACAPMDPETGRPAELRASPETVSLNKQINVQELKPVHIVRFTATGGELSDLEKGRLMGFMEAQQIKFGDTLHLELPPFNDANGLNENRFGAVGSFLESLGANVVPKILPDRNAGALRVYYSKYVATVDPVCSKGWQNPPGTDYENLNLPHMGCANASALAQMIANPKDLVDPEGIGGYDGERAARSIAKYKAGSSGKSSGGSGGGSGGEEK